jgi:phosphate transport system permease protein
VKISILLIILLIALAVAFSAGVRRSTALAGGNRRLLHSSPGHHGTLLAIWTVLPALLFALLWPLIASAGMNAYIQHGWQDKTAGLQQGEAVLNMETVHTVAEGLRRLNGYDSKIVCDEEVYDSAGEMLQANGEIIAPRLERPVVRAACSLAKLQTASVVIHYGVTGGLILAGFVAGFLRIRPRLRARNGVENTILAGLAIASSAAILTTLGIVLTVLFETIAFFSREETSLADFLFSTEWRPGEYKFGMLPLLWGTLFISGIAMIVAVPLGLLSAIYMAEYAHKRVRTVVKPALEILAGIPTIVYGFFALVIVGPFLSRIFSQGISSGSALSAGLVMGIMIIPFISSLADDVINAVPQGLRHGSYGLGATRSETILNVVLPAALPGLTGAVLLAASRAIGETMIVVLAAGSAPDLTANPLKAVTTFTVKIVSQLTGDSEFDSPQTLVAFALALTLFLMTLGLNIYALNIMRNYREHYE